MIELQYHNRENLVTWAQMTLERVDVNAEVLADLLKAAYDSGYNNGVKAGYDQGVSSCYDGSIVRFVDD